MNSKSTIQYVAGDLIELGTFVADTLSSGSGTTPESVAPANGGPSLVTSTNSTGG